MASHCVPLEEAPYISRQDLSSTLQFLYFQGDPWPLAGFSLIYVIIPSLINSAPLWLSRRSQITYYLVFLLKSKDFSLTLHPVQHFQYSSLLFLGMLVFFPAFPFLLAVLLLFHSSGAGSLGCLADPSLPIPALPCSTKVRNMDTSPVSLTPTLCSVSMPWAWYCPLCKTMKTVLSDRVLASSKWGHIWGAPQDCDTANLMAS